MKLKKSMPQERSVFLSVWMIPVLFSLLFSGVAHGEEAEFELNQIRRTESEKKIADDLTKQGREKRFRDKLARIPYSEVLKDPDNFELNYLYAQQQVANNNLLGAAATLERILLVHPELAKIRLFYAVVLFRLDNLIEAQNELERLSKLEMPDSLRKEMKVYIKEIKKRQRSTHFGIRQANGFQVDTNRNAAPKSKYQFFFGVPLGLQGSNKKRMDTSFINVTTLDGRHDLGFQAGHDVFGSFTYYRGEQTIVDSLDIASYQYKVGSTLKSRFANVTPSFQHNIVQLSGQLFLRTVSGNINVNKNFKRVSLYSDAKLEYQDYRRVNENLTAPQRKGRYIELNTGAKIKLTPTMQVLTSIGYGNKDAKSNTDSYEKLMLKLAHTWLLWRGHFLVNGLDVSFDYYDEIDPTVVSTFRRDKTMRYKTSYGAPLGTIPFVEKMMPGFMDNIVLTATYELFISDSGISNFSYINHKFQTMMTKRVEF